MATNKQANTLFTPHKIVNISPNAPCCVITLLPTLYNTPCFALQKCLFYTVKVPILQRKTTAFAKPNNLVLFRDVLSLQNGSRFRLHARTTTPLLSAYFLLVWRIVCNMIKYVPTLLHDTKNTIRCARTTAFCNAFSYCWTYLRNVKQPWFDF